MNRQLRNATAVILSALVLSTGCRPQQPFFFGERGDLSHYVGVATQIETPDVQRAENPEVDNARAPLTLANANFDETWPLSLQDAVKHALANGKVLRTLGGRFAFTGTGNFANIGAPPSELLANPQLANTIYDPAIQESSIGIDGTPIGVEGALSAFDAQLSSSVLWQKNDRPVNTPDPANPNSPILQRQDLATFQAQLQKTTATGSQFFVRNVTDYDQTIGSPFARRFFTSAWNTDMEVGFNTPLMQGSGTQFNSIAGPYNPFQGVGDKAMNGVVLARINGDIALADFEAGVRNLVFDVENAYWELYFAYRNVEVSKTGLESSLKTWQRVKALGKAGLPGGSAKDEAMAREQYYAFKAQTEVAKSELFGAESRLRYMMGLSVSDGRLIRPADEPTSAKISFNWGEILNEALDRGVELRKQKWIIKQRELEVIASKNFLLPRLDANGTYRWHGFGDQLIDPNSGGQGPYDNAFQSLMDGNFQEWELGLNFKMNLGFRAELADVRHHQLLVSRAKAVLIEQELEASHQLGDAVRTLDEFHMVAETNFNRRLAAKHQVESLQAVFDAGVDAAGGTHILDLLLEAQRDLAAAEGAYYRSLTDYNRAIAQLHYRKGSLLEYNGVYLAEGPWPAKAYFDASRLARQRDASTYLNYGFTRPSVFGKGPYNQEQHTPDGSNATPDQQTPDSIIPETIPTPPAQSKPGRTAGLRGPRLSAAPAKASGQFAWGPLGLTRVSAKGKQDDVQPAAAWQESSTEADEPVKNHASH